MPKKTAAMKVWDKSKIKRFNFWHLYGAYFVIIPVGIAAFLAKMNFEGMISLGDAGLMIGTVGSLFGLLAAFSISNGWERVLKLRDIVALEISSYLHAVRISAQLSKNVSAKLKKSIKSYLADCIRSRYTDYFHKDLLDKDFKDIYSVAKLMKVNKQEDWIYLSSVLSSIKIALDSRIAKINVLKCPMSHIRLEIMYFLGILLWVLFFIINYENPFGHYVVAVLAVVILLIIQTIRDLNNLTSQFGQATDEMYQKTIDNIDSI